MTAAASAGWTRELFLPLAGCPRGSGRACSGFCLDACLSDFRLFPGVGLFLTWGFPLIGGGAGPRQRHLPPAGLSQPFLLTPCCGRFPNGDDGECFPWPRVPFFGEVSTLRPFRFHRPVVCRLSCGSSSYVDTDPHPVARPLPSVGVLALAGHGSSVHTAAYSGGSTLTYACCCVCLGCHV